jgi:membrane-associated phospholipid phosphatase
MRKTNLQFPFDRRSAPIYIIIAAMTFVGLILANWLGFTIAPAIFPQFFGMPLLSVVGGWGLRRIGRPNFGTAMETLGLFYLQGLAAFFCIAPLAVLSAPFADPALAAADRAIGFDWIAYAKLTEPVRPVLNFAYKSFDWQPALVSVGLFTRQGLRLWETATAAVIALVFATVIFPFAPAQGASIFLHFDLHAPVQPFAPALQALKHGYRSLDNSVFTGLISMPSYHAAAALIFTWALWMTPLRWPALALNILMLAATVPLGSHYLVDILAGVAVGALAIRLSTLWYRNAGGYPGSWTLPLVSSKARRWRSSRDSRVSCRGQRINLSGRENR